MILLADLENQLFSIALYSEEGRKEHAFSTFADPLKSKEELFEFLKSYLMMLSVDVSKIQGSLLSSVVPSMTKKVQGAIELLTGMKCPVLNKSVKTGVAIRMDNPGEVGSDLLALACGAYEKYQTDTLVINVGSVVSFTIVSSKKEFVGGALFPGLEPSCKEMWSSCAQLMDIELETPTRLIGKSTKESMNSGIVAGYASLIETFSRKMEEEYQKPLHKVICGRDAMYVKPLLFADFNFSDSLLFNGMFWIYQKNFTR